MNYEIKCAPMPVVECKLDAGESMICEGGSMAWMSSNMLMETSGGGLGKMFSKAFSGEKIFQNKYTAQGGPGLIAFASSFPGSIIAVEVKPGQEIICQKSAFLAATPGVETSIYFQKKVGVGLVGGEGFILQKISGNGIAFLEIDGMAEEKVLPEGGKIVIDSGYLAMVDASCSIDVQTVGGVKNALLGGEGIFNTVVTGPGKVVLQSMPLYNTAMEIIKYMPTQG
ncbi:MAG: AIM24 family protein [Clostridia bacterium]|nr:AIM24 family protein [Clostridia bacterium]